MQRGSKEFIRSENFRLKDGTWDPIHHPWENKRNVGFNCDLCVQTAIYHIKRDKDGTPVWVGGTNLGPKEWYKGKALLKFI
jgi:hypothetical protein